MNIWKPYTLIYRLDSSTNCPLLLGCRLLQSRRAVRRCRWESRRWDGYEGIQGRQKRGLLCTGHFLLCSEDVGKRNFPARFHTATNRRSHTFSSHKFYYNFTEITIATPLLTRIFDRLTGRGIILCDNIV